MDGTDRMLALIARDHDLLELAAEMRCRAQEAIEAAERAMEAAERASEVAERAMLITVRRAVLCAAAAGGWEAVQPGRDVIRHIMLTIRKYPHSHRQVAAVG